MAVNIALAVAIGARVFPRVNALESVLLGDKE
jgi:hypothetical protein